VWEISFSIRGVTEDSRDEEGAKGGGGRTEPDSDNDWKDPLMKKAPKS